MLTFLQINDFILIKSFKGNFKKGLTTITGETGAGKSMILMALDLLSGKRLNIEPEKNIKDKADIIASFDISNNSKVINFLNEKELLDDEICILRRVINKNGTNNAFINNVKVPLKDMAYISSLLFEIHSQDSTRDIINKDNQIKIIDSFCNVNELVSNLKKLNHNYYELKEIIEDLENQKDKDISAFQLLEYKYNEFKNLNLKENEYKDLEIELKDLLNAKEYIERTEKIISIIENDSEISIKSLLNLINKELKFLNNEKENIINSNNISLDIISLLNELSIIINKENSSYSVDEDRLKEVQDRIISIESISKKNNIKSEELYDFSIKIKEEYENYNKPNGNIEELKEKLKIIKNEWYLIAAEVSKNRKEKVLDFKTQVVDILKDLKMESSSIDVRFEDLSHQVNKYGLEKPEIVISTNLGKEMESLEKTLSGGEASRVTLAIQSLLNNNINQPTIIFDEIDTGTGGTTANMIGKYMRKISENTQIICITHLPQVAVYSDNHFVVKKNPRNSDNITEVMIEEFNDNDFILEIARMLGYNIINSKIKEQVKEMISNSKGVLI